MWNFILTALTSCSAGTPKDSVAKQLLDSSAAVDVYFKGAYTALVSAQHKSMILLVIGMFAPALSCM